MSSLRTICRPHTVFSSFVYCRHQVKSRVWFRNPNYTSCNPLPSVFSSWLDSPDLNRIQPWFRVGQHRTVVRASKWTDEKSPYETLELEGDADEEQIKLAYRRLAKFYHPDVYNGRGTLEEGETAESRFIKIQAAYELLLDKDERRQYDSDNRVNPMKASQAWMEWLMKKRKAFYQRGDMAIAAWAEQQQREMNLRARRLSRSKLNTIGYKWVFKVKRKADGSVERHKARLVAKGLHQAGIHHDETFISVVKPITI